MRKPRLVRDWHLARCKCSRELGCRICGHPTTEAAHVIARRHDTEPPINKTEWHSRKPLVWPTRIVPLCPDHHRAYDDLKLDLLPYLTEDEQAQAVKDAGGVYPMIWRTSPSESPKRAA